jgi:opacity protein-like surface antigen
MRCFTSLALVGAFGTLVATAQAADMAFPPMEGLPTVSEQPAELGTGWYLRGDAAWSRDQVPLISSDGSITTPSAVINGYSFDLGFGYKINNWLRADIVYDYRKPQSASAAEANVWCPYNLVGLTSQVTPSNPDAIQLGYYANPNDTCTPQQSTTVSRQDVLLNGYIDIGTWGGVTPYVGAGIGTVEAQASSSLNYYETANGTLYNANLTPTGTYPPLWIDDYGNPVYIASNGVPTTCPGGTTPPTCPQPKVSFTQQDWNKTLKSTSYHLAWALMGGFAISVTDHLQADIGYRYVNLGTFTGLESTSSGAQLVHDRQSTQEIRVGFRYMVD